MALGTVGSYRSRGPAARHGRQRDGQGRGKLMAARALLVRRVGCDLAAAAVLPLDSYNVLRLLYEAPGHRLRLSKLAVAVFLTRSGVTRMADRLEKEGLLRRDEHIQDRRGSCAVLTAQGWNELKRARAVFA